MELELPVKFSQSKSVIVATIRIPHLENEEDVEEVSRALTECVNEAGDIHLLLDFHRVSRISVSFFSELQTLRCAVESGGGLLRLCAVAAEFRKVLALLGLNELYLAHDAKHALRKFHVYVDRLTSDRLHQTNALERSNEFSYRRLASRPMYWPAGGRTELCNATKY